MSYKQEFAENSDEFHDVELDGATSNGSIFYIDKSSLNDVLTTIGVMFLFIFVHIFTAWRTPSLITNESQFYQLNNTNGTTSVDVDVKMTALLNSHRFIHVDGSLVRNLEIDSAKTRHVEVTTSLSISKAGTVVSSEDSHQKDYNLTFTPNVVESTLFPVIERPILDYDAVLVKMTVQSDFTDLSGLKFFWSFGNPSGPKYARSSRILMAFMVAYMLILFFNKLQFSSEKYSQVLLIIVGISSIVSCNPVGLLYPTNRTVQIVDAVLVSAFIAIFRLFLISQFEIIRSSSPTPNTFFLVIISLFLAFHSTIEATATIDRNTYINNAINFNSTVKIPTEHYMQYLDYAYILINVLWIILAYVKSEPSRRLNFFAVVFALLCLTILFSHVFCLSTSNFMNTILPSMTFISMHVTTAAFSIMMLNNGGGNSYSTIKNEDNNNILDVEQMTDDDLNDPNAEEEELDDEEEEEEEEEEE